jgi:hypothetical protein
MAPGRWWCVTRTVCRSSAPDDGEQLAGADIGPWLHFFLVSATLNRAQASRKSSEFSCIARRAFRGSRRRISKRRAVAWKSVTRKARTRRSCRENAPLLSRERVSFGREATENEPEGRHKEPGCGAGLPSEREQTNPSAAARSSASVPLRVGEKPNEPERPRNPAGCDGGGAAKRTREPARGALCPSATGAAGPRAQPHDLVQRRRCQRSREPARFRIEPGDRDA